MAKPSKLALWLKELRAPFFTASALPVIIGTALAYSAHNSFDLTLFILAVSATVAIHAGANITNDYFDHISGNDRLNDNKTPFSGGSRMIQNNLLSPKEILIGSWMFLTTGAALGIVIVITTKSLFVLLLGIIGIIGGYSYTAPPLKLGYRTAGEITIGFLFGILPVYGSYYIQTGIIDFVPFFPALIVAVLIFLVIFANEFPDFEADKAVSKKTFVVSFGIKKSAFLYRATIRLLLVLSFYSITQQPLEPLRGLIFLLPILILGPKCLKNADAEKLSQKGYFELSKSAILLHLIGCIALVAAILLSKSA